MIIKKFIFSKDNFDHLNINDFIDNLTKQINEEFKKRDKKIEELEKRVEELEKKNGN